MGINGFTEAVICPLPRPTHPPPTPLFYPSPFHSSIFPSIFPPHLQTAIPPSIHPLPPFLHLLQRSKPRAHPLRPASAKSPRPLFSSLHPRSVSIFPSRPGIRDGCSTNWDLLKMSLLTGLTETLCCAVDLSFQRAAVTLLTSLISLLTAHKHGQETGAGRVLLSITSPAEAERRQGVQARRRRRHARLPHFG